MRTPILWLLVLLTACGDGGTGASGPDGGGPDGPAAPRPDAGDGGEVGYRTDLIGRIQLLERNGNPDALAHFTDAPALPPETLIDRVGECALYAHLPEGSCTPSCGGTGFCVEQGRCVPWPRIIDAGTISVTGVQDAFELVPGDLGYMAQPFPLGDLFRPGATITVTAPGNEAPGFELSATGVAGWTEAFADELLLRDDTDFTLEWNPAGGEARVRLTLRTGWHGAPWESMLLCEGPDDGSLTIAKELIAQSPPFGGAGLFPWPSEISRFTGAVAETELGPIELFVASEVALNWQH